jgi:membrane protease YdiL (CAAX protease family)
LVKKIELKKIMTFFDDNFSNPPDQNPDPPAMATPPSEPVPTAPITPTFTEDPLSYIVSQRLAYAQRPEVPEDLRISWSWIHLLCFILFGAISLLVVQTAFALYYSPHKALSQKALEQYLLSIPQFIVGSNVSWFAVILFFLYITLSVLPGRPFWPTLGWRKFSGVVSKLPGNPWAYFFSGCALSLLTSIAGSRVHTPDDMPIELLMKSKAGVALMMAMAVLVAPLVEETVFRGYLYPVLVRIISSISRFTGADPDYAMRLGIRSSILLTGLLFGILHGAQLAWTWGIVSLLILVGITFTYVRARTGTVFASYLMHLGYNSLIAFVSIIATHGFTKMPPHP